MATVVLDTYILFFWSLFRLIQYSFNVFNVEEFIDFFQSFVAVFQAINNLQWGKSILYYSWIIRLKQFVLCNRAS